MYTILTISSDKYILSTSMFREPGLQQRKKYNPFPQVHCAVEKTNE